MANLAGRVSLYGPLTSIVFFWSPKCWGKNWKHFEEEHANEEKEQIEKDEHDEDNPSRELDDFIVAETLWNTMKKDSKRYL